MRSTHNLPFEVEDWVFPAFKMFRVGSCEGLWRSTKTSYDILAITNNSPGNGHLQDVLEWFEASAKRDKKNLQILELWNQKFKDHLIAKRGFAKSGTDNLVKKFN